MIRLIVYSLSVTLFLNIINSDTLKSQGFNSISTDGLNVIAVGDSGNIIYSVNAGNSWLFRNIGMINLNSVCTSGSFFWIAGDHGNIYKTSLHDSVFINSNTGNNVNIYSVYFLSENTGYVCGDGGSIFKTLNGGINWISLNNGITNTRLNSIIFKDNNTGYVAGNYGKIYKTINGGINWIAEITNTNNNLLKIKFFGDSVICCGEYGTLIKKGISSWISVDTRVNSDIRGISTDNQNNIHICGGAGFIRNNKNGNPDFLNFESNPLLADLSDIVSYNNNLGFAVSSSNKAVIRTTDGGISWDFSNNATFRYVWENKISGQTNGYGNTLCMHPYDRNTIFAGYTNKIFVSRNKGDSWDTVSVISIPDIFRMSAFFVSSLDTSVWLACVNINYDCPVIRTTNYGVTWSIVLDSVRIGDYSHPLEMDQNIPGYFYFAAVSNGFFRSTNNGSTFEKISGYYFNNPCDMSVQFNNSDNILLTDASYPLNDSGTVYKTTNGGFDWSVKYKVEDNEIPTVGNSVFNYNLAYLASYKFYTSPNFGETWTGVSYGFEALWSLDECKEDPTSIYTGRFSGRGFLTTNGGSNFTIINNPSSSIYLSAVIYPERDYAIGMFHNSLYKLKYIYDVNVGLENNSEIVLNGYALEQNYPNPFNPKTVIRYRLASAGYTSLRVYDILGNEAAELVSKKQNPGNYSVEFSGNNFSSGIYFYKIESRNFSETRKMILLK